MSYLNVSDLNDCARCLPIPYSLIFLSLYIGWFVYVFTFLLPEFWRGGTERVARWEARATVTRGDNAVPVLRTALPLGIGAMMVLVSIVPYLFLQWYLEGGRAPPVWLEGLALGFIVLLISGAVFMSGVRYTVKHWARPRWLVPPRYRE